MLDKETLITCLYLFIRIVASVVCGAIIGYERTNKGKEAGIRTHTIVAMASCLMMIISQYGFTDFFEHISYRGIEMRLDPSRIAAQIVTGIGFLGAGMIFIQKNTITGLTTAAGIWATAGIGMAIGCEMYFIGIMCTGVIVFIQFILHKNSKFLTYHTESNMSFVLENNPEALDTLLNKLRELDITILDISYNKNGEMLDVTINVQHNEKLNKGAVIEYLYNESEIKSAMI